MFRSAQDPNGKFPPADESKADEITAQLKKLRSATEAEIAAQRASLYDTYLNQQNDPNRRNAVVMRPYVSIDIETTGIDGDYCQVLEVGAVIDDWVSPIEELKRFHTYVYHDRIVGQPKALAMHSKILDKIADAEKQIRQMRSGDASAIMIDGERFMRDRFVCQWFRQFLYDCGIDTNTSILAAGKNFGSFDRPFLESLPEWNLKFHHRAIDPAMQYWNPTIDREPPSSKECMARSGQKGEVAHTAIADCESVIRMVRFANTRDRVRDAGGDLAMVDGQMVCVPPGSRPVPSDINRVPHASGDEILRMLQRAERPMRRVD